MFLHNIKEIKKEKDSHLEVSMTNAHLNPPPNQLEQHPQPEGPFDTQCKMHIICQKCEYRQQPRQQHLIPFRLLIQELTATKASRVQ